MKTTLLTVSFPALIMSGSTSESLGYGPIPRRPFSLEEEEEEEKKNNNFSMKSVHMITY